MRKKRLTKKIVDSLKYEGAISPKGTPGLCIVMDTAVAGFFVRVFPSGKKSYGLTYYLRGRKRFYAIGRTDRVTLDHARRKAMALWQKISEGEDPADIRKQEQQILTVEQFATLYETRYARKFLRPSTLKANMLRIQRHIIPALGKKRLDAVTRQDVASLHAWLGGSSPVESNRTVQLIRALFNVAVAQGCLPDGHPNPATGIKPFPEEARDRVLSNDELQRLGDALRKEDSVIIPQVFRFILLVGSRIGETLAAEWREIDLNKGTWTIPAHHAKGKRSRTLPLPAVAVALLQALPRLAGDDRVFPVHLRIVQRAWKRICEAAGIEGATIHDVRRSAITRMVGDGADIGRVAKLAGHRDVDLTLNVYSHPETDSLRETIEKHAENVIHFLDIGKTGTDSR